MKKTLQQFAREHRHQWWWVADTDDLNELAIIEGTMNYGQFEDKKKIIDLVGPRMLKKQFEQVISQKRSNIRPEVASYWTDYIRTHHPHA